MDSIPTDKPFAVVSSRVAAAYATLPVAARRILRLCDGTRTLEAILAGSTLARERAESIVRRLAALGLISPLAAAPPRKHSLSPRALSWVQGTALPAEGFTVEEESFFASPIDHLVEDAW
jgi:hypothetical protein